MFVCYTVHNPLSAASYIYYTMRPRTAQGKFVEKRKKRPAFCAGSQVRAMEKVGNIVQNFPAYFRYIFRRFSRENA